MKFNKIKFIVGFGMLLASIISQLIMKMKVIAIQ